MPTLGVHTHLREVHADSLGSHHHLLDCASEAVPFLPVPEGERLCFIGEVRISMVHTPSTKE